MFKIANMATTAELDQKASKIELEKIAMDCNVNKVDIEIVKDRMSDFNSKTTSLQHETNSVRTQLHDKIDTNTFFGKDS